MCQEYLRVWSAASAPRPTPTPYPASVRFLQSPSRYLSGPCSLEPILPVPGTDPHSWKRRKQGGGGGARPRRISDCILSLDLGILLHFGAAPGRCP